MMPRMNTDPPASEIDNVVISHTMALPDEDGREQS